MSKLTNLDKTMLIVKKMQEAGWGIEKIENCSVNCYKNYAKLCISFEECACHGGRISIAELNHTQSYYRIEHSEYDKKLGIVDSETELLWEIENELMIVVNSFNKMTFKVETINEYGKDYSTGGDKIAYRYFSSEDDAFNFIIKYKKISENIHSFTETTIDYPNEKYHLTIKKIEKEEKYSWDKNKIWFKCLKTDDNWKTSKEYQIVFSVFNKAGIRESNGEKEND